MLGAHVVRNGLLPTIAVVATQVGYLFGGIVAIEKLFGYPGIGFLTLDRGAGQELPDAPRVRPRDRDRLLRRDADRRPAHRRAEPAQCVLRPRNERHRREHPDRPDPRRRTAGSADAVLHLDSPSRVRRETLGQILRSKTFIVGAVVTFFWIACAVFGQLDRAVQPDRRLASRRATSRRRGRTPSGSTGTAATCSRASSSGREASSRSRLRRRSLGVEPRLDARPRDGLLRRAGSTTSLGRILDAVLAIPLIVLAILVLTALSAGQEGISVTSWQLIVVIGIAFTPPVARTVRSAVLAERDLDYVQAAKLRGERAPYIMFAEILPNVTGPIIVEATVRLGYAVFTVATLAFLGLRTAAAVARLGAPDRRAVRGHLARLVGRRSSPRSRSRRSSSRSTSLPTPCSRWWTNERSRRPRATYPPSTLRDVEIVYRVRGRDREVVRGVSFTIEQRQSYGLVGESGCGKSTVALVDRALPPAERTRHRAARSRSPAADVLALRGEALRRYRRDVVSMVYQNPGSALNPTLRVGRQVREVFELRGVESRARHAIARSPRCGRYTSPTPNRCCAATRTSSPAGCSSES